MCSCYILITREVCRQCASLNELTLLKSSFFRENPKRSLSLSGRCHTHSFLVLPKVKQYENKLKDYPNCPNCRGRRARNPGIESVAKESARSSSGMSRSNATTKAKENSQQHPGLLTINLSPIQQVHEALGHKSSHGYLLMS